MESGPQEDENGHSWHGGFRHSDFPRWSAVPRVRRFCVQSRCSRRLRPWRYFCPDDFGSYDGV